MSRRNFLMLTGGGSVALLAARMPAMAGADTPAHDDLVDAYAKHLRATKGILDIRTIRKSGSGPNFLDVVVVSAGFTADQMGEFHRSCERFTKTLLSTQPWKRYKDLVNVHAVFVGDESVDSTRLKVDGYKGNVLGCDDGAAVEYGRCAANSAATVVIHNSEYSTASNGVWGVAALNKGDVNDPLASVHELGHGMAGLGDEYIQREGPFTDPPESLWNTVNVTAEAKPRLCKWHYWTENEWPGLFGPSKLPKGAKVANFEGAGWPKKIYRPEETCLMRGDRDAFCVVCNETMETSFFRYIDLFKAAEPTVEDIVLWKGEHLDLHVSAIDLLHQPPEWLKSRLSLYLDGEQVATSDRGDVSFRFPGTASEPGIHHLGANLNVQSECVRQDFGFLSSSRSWRVKIIPCAKPQLALTPRVSVASDGAIDVPVYIKRAKSSLFELKMAHAPAGAVLEGGRFQWKPAGAAGSWRVDFTVSHEHRLAVTESMEIHVTRAKKGEDAIEVHPLDTIDAVTGKQVVLQLKAHAKDAGHLLFEPVDILAGVELNRYTGDLSWTPLIGQAGPKRMRFRVKNGLATREFDVLFRVRRVATPSPVSFCNEYIPRTLDALKQLKQSQVIYRRLFETLRLLRDRYEQIYQKALAEAKSLYKELGPKLRNNCLQELHLHAWEFANKPDILKWMRGIADGEKSGDASILIKRLNEIDSYNVNRTKAGTA
jgi:hypothetical protein